MRVSTILDNIDNGRMALPQFQRGYVWNGNQVRAFMDSMYRRHPVGSLLAWNTEPGEDAVRSGQELASGVVQLLLDGQQRITSLYGIIRGAPPPFFNGNGKAFTGLHFDLREQVFWFWQPSRMQGDPLWIDVSALMQRGLGEYIRTLSQNSELSANLGEYVNRLNDVYNIRERELHIEEVTGDDKTLDVVVDIFNRVNSSGTKLSKGDLALAKICVSWPDARERMSALAERWNANGYRFSLDWVLRNINAIVTGEADFFHLHDVQTPKIRDGVDRAERSIEIVLNLIADRLGLDHDQALFGKNALPVMTHYVDRRGGRLTDPVERDRLLYWFFGSAMWGRFSASIESALDQELGALEEMEGGLDRLLERLRLWRGSLHVEPDHFVGNTRRARFYPVLYALTRVGEARDWGTGQALRRSLLGKMSALELHHIFPKALLRDLYHFREINAVANFCFLTRDTNLQIGARPPSEYFPEVEARHPGALASQWIPMAPELWEVENYPRFLEARRALLADAANRMLGELRHEAAPAPAMPAPAGAVVAPIAATPPGGVEAEDEEAALSELREWVRARDLPEGDYGYDLAHPETGESIAVLDLAWPDGLQPEYSQPVAVMLDEDRETLQIANDHGFRHFTSVEAFKRYAETEVLGPESEAAGG